LKEGREEGIQVGQLEALSQAVVEIVLKRFPRIVRLARKQVAVIEDTSVLLNLIDKLSVAQSAEEAKQHLLAVDEDEDQE
jgi:hypothetical protein